MAALRLDFEWRDLEIEVIDPKSTTLVRLFKHPHGEWKPTPKRLRNLRVDPPDGRKERFAVLYTSSSLETIGQECNVLAVDYANRWTLNEPLEAAHRIARYGFSNGGIFVRLDGRNSSVFGLDAIPASGGYAEYQQLGFELYERFVHIAHGVSWRSYHRHQNGRVFAIWHSRKRALGLKLQSVADLASDGEWLTVKSRIAGLTSLA